MCWPSTNEISLLCRHNDYKVASPALRAVGNIVTGDDIQTQVKKRRAVLWIKPFPAKGFGPDESQHGLGEKAWACEKCQLFHFIYDHGQLGCLHFFYKWEANHYCVLLKEN